MILYNEIKIALIYLVCIYLICINAYYLLKSLIHIIEGDYNKYDIFTLKGYVNDLRYTPMLFVVISIIVICGTILHYI